MLDRTRNPERNVKLGRDGLSRRSNLTINRQPLGVANRPGRSEISTERFRKLLRQHEIVFTLDPAPNRDDHFSLCEIDSLLRFLERRLGFHSHLADLDSHILDRRSTTFRSLIAAISSRLESREHGGFTVRHDISIELAEENSARESELAAFGLRANTVADERLAETRGELRSEVTHLVRVRQENKIRIDLLNNLLHAVGIGVGRVVS